MAKSEKFTTEPADSPALHPSYGNEIPQPSMVKGEFVAFGEAAGSTNTSTPLVPRRNISFGDSISDNRKNQPASR